MLLLDEVRDAWRSEPRDHRVALALIIVVAVALRLAHLAQPMRYDESVAWVEFARYPFAQALSRYHHPSNHLFHTLLERTAAIVFGSAPWALRLPALGAGILIVPATWAVARAIYGSRAALIAAALVSASAVLTLYSANARGYSIVGLAFLVLVLVAMRLMRAPSIATWAAFGVVGTLGLWTIPVMLYPLGAVMLWLGLTFVVDGRRADLRWLTATLIATVALTALAYAPAFSHQGLAAVIRNQYVEPSPWPVFLSETSERALETLDSWGLGMPPLFSVLLAGCAVYALSQHATLSTTRVGLPLAAFVWCAWLMVVSHRAPMGRVWQWLLPVAAALVGSGVVALLERWPRTRALAERRVPLIAALLAAGAGASVGLSGAVRLTRDTGTYRDAELAVAALKAVVRPGDRILAAVPTNAPIAYYSIRSGLDPAYLMLDAAQAERLIVVVDAVEGQSLGAILGTTPARDTASWVAGIVTTLPNSTVFLFTRRDAKR